MNDDMNLKALLEEWVNFYPKRDTHNFKYNSMYELVLKDGELLTNEPYTEAEESYLEFLFSLFYGPARLKTCYETATRLSLDTDFIPGEEGREEHGWTYEYGEGFGIDANLHIPLPIEHAIFILNGKPVDIVWRPDNKKGKYAKSPKAFLERAKWCLANNQYYMLKIPIRYMEKAIIKKGTYGVLEFNRELIEKGKEAWQQ